MQATLDKHKSDLERAKADYDRASTVQRAPVRQAGFRQRKYTYEAQQAAVRQSRNAPGSVSRPARPDRGAVAVLPETHRQYRPAWCA